MEKEWRIKPLIKDKMLMQFPEYSPVVLQLLFNRGIIEKQEIIDFLEKDYDKLHDPFLFSEMDKSVDLIIKHIKKGSKICVYGDYDADGVTASAALIETLNTLRAKADVYIPDRVSEGYGMNKTAIKKIIDGGVKLIITVDNGIRNKKEVEYIKSKNVDVIITDHHPTDEDNGDIPDTLVIDGALEKEKYPFKKLAGVAVAFKVAKAIISKSKLDDDDKVSLEERLLDLVAVGTIADLVILLGENRILVKRGLEVINNTNRTGLKELIKVAKIYNNTVEAWNIGFQIAPRLNAAGRMAHANDAYKLLVTKDKKEAKKLALRLNNRNIERQNVTEEIVDEVDKMLEADKEDILIGVCQGDKAWNEGVVGLVAGRITEKYYKPTLVITKTDEGYKGSGRSIKGFNLALAVEECKDLLMKYGGHPMACGFSLKEDNLEKFVKKLKDIAKRELGDKKNRPILDIEYEIDIKDIDEALVKEIELFSPFGQGNQKPKFLSKNVIIKDIMTMGNESQHIKFRFNGFWGLAFGKAKEWEDYKIGDSLSIVYYIEKNEFNGRSEIQFKLVDIKARNA